MKLDSLGNWVRTNSANVTTSMDGSEVTLFGWVQEVRDLGGIRFIILQDREGFQLHSYKWPVYHRE